MLAEVRSVSGGSPVGTRSPRGLLDADEVRVQRLAAVVELDLDVREPELDVLADALRLGRRRVAADEHRDDLAVVVDRSPSSSHDRVGRRGDRGDDAACRVSAIQSPAAIGPHSRDRVAHGLRDLARAHALDAPSLIASSFASSAASGS